MTKLICVVCGKIFFSKVSIAKTCSKKCCNKRYSVNNKEKIKKYRIDNKEKIKNNRAEYYKKNKEIEKSNSKKWYLRNRNNEIEKNKEYRKQNRELFDWYHNKERFDGLRNIIISRDNFRCVACHSSDKLSVHHKDGSGGYRSKKLKSNNEISNLITLCASCHSKLHRYQIKHNIVILQDEDIVRTCRRLQEVGVNIPR